MPSSGLEAASQTVQDINILAAFLAHPQISPSSPRSRSIKPSTLIIAASAILQQPHIVFSYLRNQAHNIRTQKPHLNFLSSISTLVLTGGIGHSTTHLYSAVLKHPVYSTLPTLLNRPEKNLGGIPEARLLYEIFTHYYDGEQVTRTWNGGKGLKVIVEEDSTNCGANARLSRAMMEREGVRLGTRGPTQLDDVLIVQDPTMSLRTKASFEKSYEKEVGEQVLRFWTWPVVVPVVACTDEGEIVWSQGQMEDVDAADLWSMKRFYGLILGEIPRLRDDENGYGPKGKDFIPHFDVPFEVEHAWKRLSESLDHDR